MEFIPAYNVEVIVAVPPYQTASGPKGDAQGWGDWPLFLVKYRFLSANKDNGNYIVSGFFQMTDALGTRENLKPCSNRAADARGGQGLG